MAGKRDGVRRGIEDCLAAHAGARQTIGKEKGRKGRQDGRGGRDEERVSDRLGQSRRGEEALEVHQSDKFTRPIFDCLLQQGAYRQQHAYDERDAEHEETGSHEQVVATHCLPERCCPNG